MSLTELLRLVRSRWWLVAAVTLVCAVGAFVYSLQQHARYASTVALYARPSETLVAAGQTVNDLDLLTSGAVLPTLADIAASPSLLHTALPQAGLAPSAAGSYHVTAQRRSDTTVIDLSVTGPNSAAVGRLAAAASAALGEIASTEFLDTLTPVAPPRPATQIRPRTGKNMLAGTASGLLAGIALASVSMQRAGAESSRQTRSARDDD